MKMKIGPKERRKTNGMEKRGNKPCNVGTLLSQVEAFFFRMPIVARERERERESKVKEGYGVERTRRGSESSWRF